MRVDQLLTHEIDSPKASSPSQLASLSGPSIYCCSKCLTHLTTADSVISKSFHGRHGRAYLFEEAVNVGKGPTEDRLLITGMHCVCDIFCKSCQEMVGWTYER